MASADTDKMLRDMASVRGYRLVKSRRRKPGGDYGRYGLTDRSGKACFGIGEQGLNASAKEIADFLRGRAQSDWKGSLSASDDVPEPTRRRAARPSRKAEPSPRRASAPVKVPEPEPARRRQRNRQPETPHTQRELPLLATVRPVEPAKSRPEPKARPRRELEIREATSRDAAGIASLIEEGEPPSTRRIATTIATLAEQGTPVLVADQEGVVGAVSYDVLLPLHHSAPLGRITFIATARTARRKGIGGKLLEAVEERLGELGCDAFELVNPIEVSNANQFLRDRDYQRSGYRFIKLVDD